MITKNVKLYLGDGFPVRIPVSQYDTMWRFVFSIINGSVEWTIPTGATAVLNGRKPDGNVIAISGTIADNKVTVDATEQMTVVAGEVVCELSIMSGGAVVGTANFVLAVEDAPKKDGEPISESDLSAYAEMIEAAGELVGEAQEIIAHGPFLPSGGTPGQVLTKTATGETWDDVNGLPDGGANGQVLTRQGDGAEWSDAGTPTQAQTDSAVAAWLDAHPEATTTVQDGSVTVTKLAPDVVEKVPSYNYKNKLLFNMQDLASLERGGYVDNVWAPSETGTKYATGYVDIEEYGLYCGYMEKQNQDVYFYDENKAYLSKARKSGTFWIDSKTVTNAKYFVVAGSASYNGKYTISVQESVPDTRLVLTGRDVTTQIVSEKTLSFELAKGVKETLFVIPGEQYSVKKVKNAEMHIVAYSMASPSVAYKNEKLWQYGTGGTYVVSPGVYKIEIVFPYTASTVTITGKFIEPTYENHELKLVGDNFTQDTFDLIADGLGISIGKDVNEAFYNCTKYGVLPGNADNTSALQALINTVNANGGGVIWMPSGTYNFIKESSTSAMSGNAQNNVYLKNNVSIVGEGIDSTILRLSGSTQTGCSLFGYFSQDNRNAALVGCSFSNFTVDMTDLTMATYTHKGKAFYVSGIKDSVFRDLRLIGTPSTALGIDMLDNVVIDSIYCYNCGRQWASGGNGGACIGIGTGKWANENYIIRNCVIDTAGHFGIFLEDQGIFGTAHNRYYSKGQIICNNVIRNGRNYGIGLRGGQNVLITGNNIYACVGGLYVDYGAKNAVFSNNLVQGCSGAAFNYGNESTLYPCEKIVVTGNAFMDNAIGIKKTLAPIDSVEINNVFIGNTTDQ